MNLPVSYHKFQTKAQPLEHLEQHKKQLIQNHLIPDTYPIIQLTDVTLNTNKTEPFTQSTQKANYAELINTIKISLPAIGDFITKFPNLYSYFHNEQTELYDKFLYQAQQQKPNFRQLLLWKRYKNYLSIPSFSTHANKGLVHYYRSFQNLSIKETNHLLYFIQETTPPKICVQISLLLIIFHIALSHYLSGHPGLETTHDTITENYYFPNNQTWIAILKQDCLNCQTSKFMPNLLMAQQQTFLEFSPYFNHRISMNTKAQFPRFRMRIRTLLPHI